MKDTPVVKRIGSVVGVLVSVFLAFVGWASPVIDPIGNVAIPAGKSLILPITATSSGGLPLTYTITSSTNAIAVVMHTNNPFWQLTVARAADNGTPGAYQTPFRGGLVTVTNVGAMTFMLLPEYAPHTVNVFQGLTYSGFYNSNTIFHRVISGFMIQGGDPKTNGLGGLVFHYNDEFHPQAMFSGYGQLALANSGIDTDGSQFFVTIAPFRSGDFNYTIFGQMVRGFPVLTNLNSAAVDTNSRPLANEIIQTAAFVTNTTDTVLTLIATNIAGINGTITVVAADGAGGFATNTFIASTVTDTNSNHQPFFYPDSAPNVVVPLNATSTNFVNALELDGDALSWSPAFGDQISQQVATNSSLSVSNSYFRSLTYNVVNTNGQLQLFIKTTANYAGTTLFYLPVSSSPQASLYWQFGENPPNYDYELLSVTFGDTPIYGQSNTVTALAGVPFTNLVLATFTNGVPHAAPTNFLAYVNWGDDTTNVVPIIGSASGYNAVLGSHTYSYPGAYPAYVQVQSAIGATATIISTVNVLAPTAPQTNLLTVQIAGQGTVIPSYIAAPLTDGATYTVTASPANAWLFTGWTDQNGFVLGTGTNLTFTMSPGLSLTANFTAPLPPSVVITSPANGQVLTNFYTSPVTVSGTASDNITVTSVWYQVNAGGWQQAAGIANWTASFLPVYGSTNVFQAFAVNSVGGVSATNTLLVEYLPMAILTLNTNGLGAITPAIGDQLLFLGTNCTLTATAAGGFTFTNWSGSLSNNNKVLSFMLNSNMTLTASFVDQTRPTLTIMNPTSGQQITSNTFTVGGKTSDNWKVAGVVYSLNNSAWTAAASTNNWTNWTAPLTLVGGTNSFAAYATDPNGLSSLTNTVNFQFLVTNQLRITAVGRGTISPNDSNVWLQVGRNYSIAATPAANFAFTNWIISTNGLGGVVTNNSTVQFTMATNLTLQVTFAETAKPTLTITYPTSAQRLTNALPTVIGTASDVWGVSQVFYSLNGAAWTAPTTTNSWTNWSTTVEMAAGTNTFRAYAQNLGGNFSTTNSISVFSTNAFLLQMTFLAGQPLSANGLNLDLLVSTGLAGHIQFSTDLVNWATLTNFTGSNSPLHLFDPAATNSANRYYRAVIP